MCKIKAWTIVTSHNQRATTVKSELRFSKNDASAARCKSPSFRLLPLGEKHLMSTREHRIEQIDEIAGRAHAAVVLMVKKLLYKTTTTPYTWSIHGGGEEMRRREVDSSLEGIMSV